MTTGSGEWIKNGTIARPVHIICSPYKTGTTSVGKALVSLGIGSRDMPYDRALMRSILPQLRDLNRLAHGAPGFRAFHRMYGTHVRESFAPVLPAIAPYDVFHDAPFGHVHMHVFIRRILAPQARFIWVNRERHDWLDSVRRWEETHPDIYPTHVEWADAPEKRTAKKLGLWQRNYRQFKRIRRFAPEHCLELEWEDLGDWGRLARFYSVPVPDCPFPKENIGLTQTEHVPPAAR